MLVAPLAELPAALDRWVVARSLCRYRHFQLGAVAPAQRRAVLRNLLLAWAPFDDSNYRVVLRGDAAAAWAWDGADARAQLDRAGAPAKARLWPETLLRQRPLAEGVRAVRALEGHEAQLWLHGELQASRWWPTRPADDEWTRWCRTLPSVAAAAADPARPAEVMAGWCAPWAEAQDLDALASTRSRIEQLALWAALAGLAGLTGAQAHLAWDTLAQQRELSAEAERLAVVSAPVRAAREQALELLAQAQTLSRHLVAVQPLEVLQHLVERLPPRGVQLKEFELTGLRLRIALEASADVARAALVKDLQAAGWLQQVTEVRDTAGRGWLGFEMQLAAPRPPAAMLAPPPAATEVAPTLAAPAARP